MSDQINVSAIDLEVDYSLQDVLRCALCDGTVQTFICKSCQIRLCKNCVEQHLMEGCKQHTVELINHQKYLKCRKQDPKRCEQVVDSGCCAWFPNNQHENVISSKLEPKKNHKESSKKTCEREQAIGMSLSDVGQDKESNDVKQDVSETWSNKVNSSYQIFRRLYAFCHSVIPMVLVVLIHMVCHYLILNFMSEC